VLQSRTNECLRNDKSTCFKPDSPFYQITHNGLDAMLDRYADTYEAFANLPAELAFANHTLCEGERGERVVVRGLKQGGRRSDSRACWMLPYGWKG
jgi:hypothetical protein